MGKNAGYRVPMPGTDPNDGDPWIDWRFAQGLRAAESAFDQKVQNAKKPGGYRDDFGDRNVWRNTLPSKEEMQAAKDALKDCRVSWNSTCPCCQVNFCMVSAYVSIKEHGLCEMCQLFAEGKFKGVILRRPPTLEEAMSVPDIRPAEAFVIKRAYLQLLGSSGAPSE